MNVVSLVGRLARDPEIRTTADGVQRAWFVLAVPRASPGRDGRRDADFIPVVAWRQLAAVVAEHLRRGRLVGVTGHLRVEQVDAAGGRRTATEVVADQVVFLDAPRRAAPTGR
jgi:single-strand DNA-binding protein